MHNEHFFYVIEKFCDSLALFVKSLSTPITINKTLIQNKRNRSKKFDAYVDIIEEFTNLNTELIFLLKQIIFSLNKLLIEKTDSSLLIFLDDIRSFLNFIVKKNVFDELNEIKDHLNANHLKDLKIYDKIAKVKHVLFDIFNVTIGITSIFIPQLSVVFPVLSIIEYKTTKKLSYEKYMHELSKIDMDDIIKHILNIELQSQILLHLDSNKIKSCLDTMNSDIKKIVSRLQNDYIEIYQLSLYLRSEIDKYRKKKFTINSLIRNILHIK